MNIVKLQAYDSNNKTDGEPMSLDSKIARLSFTIDKMLNNKEYNVDEDGAKVIHVRNCERKVLEEVIDWMKYHKDDPKKPLEKSSEDEIESQKNKIEVSKWDAQFLGVKVDQSKSWRLLAAADKDCLDIPGLWDVICANYCNLTQKKNPHQLRDFLEISNDFTEKEYKKVIEENQYLKP